MTPWLAVEQFGYERRRHHFAALQLLATVQPELGVPADQLLLVENDASSSAYAPRASRIAPPGASARLIDSPSALLWRVEFAVPLEVVEYPHSMFSLTAEGRAPIALPAPHLLSVDAPRMRLSGARVRRHLVALAAGLAVAAASGSPVGVASAATLKHAAPHQAAMIKPVTLGSLKPTHTKTLVTTNTAPGVAPPAPARCHPKSAALSSHNPVPSLQYKPQLQSVVPAVTGKSEICHSTGPTHGHGSAHKRRHHHRHHHNHQHHHPHDKGTQHSHSGPSVHDERSNTSRGPSHRPVDPDDVTTTATSSGLPGSGGSAGFHLDPATVAALSQTSSRLATDNQPPTFLIPIYQAAGKRYHVPWQILAAINWIETDYGANLNISSAGAMGWMQFMPATWRQYGVAADGQSRPNPYSPQDAIFAAAKYLAAAGAAQNLPKAIYAYNHATWYVVEVMQRAQIISEHVPASTDTSLNWALKLDPVAIAALSQASSGRAIGNQPPAFLIPIYQAAAHRYHVPWRILAAMNWIETNYGANLSTSSPGAMGWMQFTPGTWQRYGVAADGQSKPNPHSPLDAIFSAAHFLAVNGAKRNLPKAIYAYNHATFYAVDVIRRAHIIRDHAHASTDTSPAGNGRTGLAGAETMLLAAYSAVGGPYSQANHDSFGQTAPDLRRLGTDCSGFVSWVLDQAHPGFGNQTTVTLPGQPGIELGVGHYVTMWDRPLPGNQGHVIINILGTWFESGGNTTYNPAGGIGPMSEPQAVGELAGGGFLPFHLKGL